MKRRRARVLFFIFGLLFLVLAPVWRLFLAPFVLQIPKDFSFTADIVSVDNFYNAERGAFTGEQYSKTSYQYQVTETNGKNALVKNTFDVRAFDGTPIFSVEREYGINRQTGQHVGELGDKSRTGYLFAPAHLASGEPFTYWHINYDGPAEMQFSGIEVINNLEVYRYQTHYQGVTIDQTDNLGGLPEVGETRGVVVEPYLEVWVEPITGRLIKYRDDSLAYYYDLASGQRLHPWNHFSNSFSEQSVAAVTDDVTKEKAWTEVVELYIPVALVVLGGLCWLIAFNGVRQIRRLLPSSALRLLTGLIISLAGAVFFFGWVLQSRPPVRLTASVTAILPFTGLLFIVLGAAIALRSVWHGRLSAFLGGLSTLFGVASIIEFFAPTTLTINQWLFTSYVAQLGAPALYIGFSATLLGFALLVAKAPHLRKWPLVEITTAVVLLLSLVAAIGYLYEPSGVLLSPFFTAVALRTSGIFCVLSVAIFFWFRQRKQNVLNTKNSLLLFGLLFCATLLTLFATTAVERVLRSDAQRQFINEINRAEQALLQRINIYTSLLEGAQGLLAASESVERGEWHAYIESLGIAENYPGIQGIGYSVFVPASEKAAFEASVQAEGYPNFIISPPGQRQLYSAVKFIEPFSERNRQAFGFDMFQEAVRRTAMEQARDTGTPQISGRITLVQEVGTDIQPGFILYVPHYANGQPTTTLEEKRQNIVGYAYGPFRAGDFVQSVIGSDGLAAIGLQVVDGAVLGTEHTLYDDTLNKISASSRSRFTDTRTIYVAGRPWTLLFSSSEDYGQTSYTRALPIISLAVGLVVSSLIALIFYTLLSSRQRAISYADRLTRDLIEAQRIGKFGNFTWHVPSNRVTWSNESFVMHGFLPTANHQPPPQAEYFSAIHPEDRAAAQRSMEAALSGEGEQSHKYRVIWPDGSIHAIRVTSKLTRNEAGQPEMLEGTYQDITKEQEVDQAKTEFVSLASHQLRTPLSAINWYSEMLLSGDSGKLNQQQQELMQQVADSNRRMIDLVGSLLNVSRIDLGTFAVDPVPTDFKAVAESVLGELQAPIATKNLKVTTWYAPELPLIPADPKLLRMVFQNLLSNAVKYTPEKGEIRLAVGPEPSGKEVRITVADTGFGIPLNAQEKIFTKLYRADNAREKDADGNGLGLYIVKSIVEQSQGKIWFESQENKGTTFFVHLPLSGMRKKTGAKALEAKV